MIQTGALGVAFALIGFERERALMLTLMRPEARSLMGER